MARTVGDLQDFLRGLCAVPEPSTDHILAGGRDQPIRKIGTAWLGYQSTLEAAVREGVDVLVVHEPLFYCGNDLVTNEGPYERADSEAYQLLRQRKVDFLCENGLAVLRCHDVLDSLPDIGIPFAWGRELGFRDEDLVRSQRYYNVYRLSPQPAEDVAKRIAAKVQELGQPGVQFYGDPQRTVETVGVGTGCYCEPSVFRHLKPDLFVAIDDAIRHWTDSVYAADTGHPIVAVNHGTSEEAGMRALAALLRRELAPLPVVHFPQGCAYRWITASSP